MAPVLGLFCFTVEHKPCHAVSKNQTSNFDFFSCPRLACAVPRSVMVLGNGGKAAHMVKGTQPRLRGALCGWAMVLGKLDDDAIFISLHYFQLTLGSVKTQPQRVLVFEK